MMAMHTVDFDQLIRGTPDIPSVLWFRLNVGEEESVVRLDAPCTHLL